MSFQQALLRLVPFAAVCVALTVSVLLLRQEQRSLQAHADALATQCPVMYERRSAERVAAGVEHSYLFGNGIAKGRRCPNCRKKNLFTDICTWTGTEFPFFQQNRCSPQQTLAVLSRVSSQEDSAPLLLTPCDVWPLLRGRTIWLLGDSIMKDVFTALICFMLEFWDLKQYMPSDNATAIHLLESLPLWGFPACVHLPENTRICKMHVVYGDLLSNSSRHTPVLPLLHESGIAHHDDIFVVNFGLWHAESHAGRVYDWNLHALGQLYERTRTRFPHLLWLETPKQHFGNSNDGDYQESWLKNKTLSRGPFVCKPMPVQLTSRGEVLASERDGSSDVPVSVSKGSPSAGAVGRYLAGGTWRNRAAASILGQYNIPLIPIYNMTTVMWDVHRKNEHGQECSHYCHPGVPQLWVYQLYRTLLMQPDMQPITNPMDWRRRVPQRGTVRVLEKHEREFEIAHPQ